jgi:hypothetical protein
MTESSRRPLDEPSVGPLVDSRVVGDIFRQMDEGQDGDDDDGGVREPRRPDGAPPALSADVNPDE